jgi:hypothetical protein
MLRLLVLWWLQLLHHALLLCRNGGRQFALLL